MDNHPNTRHELDRHAEDFRRIRYALMRGVTFEQYLQARDYWQEFACQRLRDWADNPRLAPLDRRLTLRIN